MGEVGWTPEAESWLRAIHDYIAMDSPEAAQRTIRGIIAKARSLTSSPERGYRHPDRLGRNVRIILYGHYRLP